LGDSAIGEVLETLVPTYRGALSPIQLPISLGRKVYHRSTSEGGFELSGSKGVNLGKDYTWSKGLGVDISPIKTRSVRKRKEKLDLLPDETHLPVIVEYGVLRGMKALAREKPRFFSP
jgi:hypothetical protein